MKNLALPLRYTKKHNQIFAHVQDFAFQTACREDARIDKEPTFIILLASSSINSGLKKKKIQPLFTLGSVYSTSASGAEQTIETNNSNTT